MDTTRQLEDLLARLLRQIRTDVDCNIRMGPEWLASEGERVLGLAMALPASPAELLGMLSGSRITEFLGEGWLDCHAESRLIAEQVERLLSRHNAA